MLIQPRNQLLSATLRQSADKLQQQHQVLEGACGGWRWRDHLSIILHVMIYNLVGHGEVKKSLVEKESLVGGSNESNHSKTAVDDLLFVVDLLLLITDLGPPLWHKSVNNSRSAISIESLLPVGKLKNSNGKKSLEVGSESDGRDGLKWVGGGIGLSGKVPSVLLPNHSSDSKHADTSVLQLSPTRVTEVSLDIRKAHGVKAHISRHGSIKLFRDGKEGDRFGHLIERHRGASHLSGGEGGGGGDGGGKDDGLHGWILGDE
mmetsp:Transcript_12267/g.16042  ORF Transcript_12267/g.16042 Transcript_12267/m.16042 type:complete len:261 (+) Transcript_12267:154-936(+)